MKRNYLVCLILYSLAEELLAKESIGLPDIISILGDRPFPMKESLREYLTELMERKVKEETTAAVPAEETTEKKEDVAEALNTEIPAEPVEEEKLKKEWLHIITYLSINL